MTPYSEKEREEATAEINGWLNESYTRRSLEKAITLYMQNRRLRDALLATLNALESTNQWAGKDERRLKRHGVDVSGPRKVADLNASAEADSMAREALAGGDGNGND